MKSIPVRRQLFACGSVLLEYDPKLLRESVRDTATTFLQRGVIDTYGKAAELAWAMAAHYGIRMVRQRGGLLMWRNLDYADFVKLKAFLVARYTRLMLTEKSPPTDRWALVNCDNPRALLEYAKNLEFGPYGHTHISRMDKALATLALSPADTPNTNTPHRLHITLENN